MLTTPIVGQYFRVANSAWEDPIDPSFAAHDPGKRWNPSGLACLYLNRDKHTARANLSGFYVGSPYRPEDLDPATGPVLLSVDLPAGNALDVFTPDGVSAAGLPPTYPLDATGNIVPHDECQVVGEAAFNGGLDGVDCRSAAPTGERELAWFPRGRTARITSRIPFRDWAIG